MACYSDAIRVSEERVKQAVLDINGDSILHQYCPVLSKVSVIDYHTQNLFAIEVRGG